MQFSAALLLALSAAVMAAKNSTNTGVIYTTVTVDTYTTVCPASSTIIYGGSTYINTATVESTVTLPCPCTLVHPVTTTSSVICNTCTTAPFPSKNSTVTGAPATKITSAPAKTSPVTAGAQKVVLSGASLAGLVALAAYAL